MAAIKRIVSGVFAGAVVAAALTFSVVPAQADPIDGQCGPVGGVERWTSDCTFTTRSEADNFVSQYIQVCHGQSGEVISSGVSGGGQRWKGYVNCDRT